MDGDFEVDLDAIDAKITSRRSDTGAERRSARSAVREAPKDYYGQRGGSVEAEMDPSWSRRATRKDAPTPLRLPRGAKASDYDLSTPNDVVVWKCARSRPAPFPCSSDRTEPTPLAPSKAA
jgi:hypothetical protein